MGRIGNLVAQRDTAMKSFAIRQRHCAVRIH
jgi:hypothetical protein